MPLHAPVYDSLRTSRERQPPIKDCPRCSDSDMYDTIDEKGNCINCGQPPPVTEPVVYQYAVQTEVQHNLEKREPTPDEKHILANLSGMNRILQDNHNFLGLVELYFRQKENDIKRKNSRLQRKHKTLLPLPNLEEEYLCLILQSLRTTNHRWSQRKKDRMALILQSLVQHPSRCFSLQPVIKPTNSFLDLIQTALTHEKLNTETFSSHTALLPPNPEDYLAEAYPRLLILLSPETLTEYYQKTHSKPLPATEEELRKLVRYHANLFAVEENEPAPAAVEEEKKREIPRGQTYPLFPDEEN